jgi:hypothetical protein
LYQSIDGLLQNQIFILVCLPSRRDIHRGLLIQVSM